MDKLNIDWKLGVEIELLAPHGRSRQDLAIAIAHYYDATVRRIFHLQSEPSKVPGTPFFENLTLGFVVEDKNGNMLAQCVDDLTIQNDLNQKSPPQPHWYRIVSDDSRLLYLTLQNANAEDPIESVLLPIAQLFATDLEQSTQSMFRASDKTGAPIAIATPLPGERERPCELITPPLDNDHFERLNTLMILAKGLNFSAPEEGAIHLHFDAMPLCNTITFINLINLLHKHGQFIKQHMNTNKHCRRLGNWPDTLFDLIANPAFIKLPWQEAQQSLKKIKLTKYCDFNIMNMVHNTPNKHTFEVRILPVYIEAKPIINAAQFFIRLFNWAKDHDQKLKKVPDTLNSFLEPS